MICYIPVNYFIVFRFLLLLIGCEKWWFLWRFGHLWNSLLEKMGWWEHGFAWRCCCWPTWRQRIPDSFYYSLGIIFLFSKQVCIFFPTTRRLLLFLINFWNLLFLLLSVIFFLLLTGIVIMPITKNWWIIIVFANNFLLIRSKPNFIHRHIIELLWGLYKRVQWRVGIKLISQRCEYRCEILLNWWLGRIRREMLYDRNFFIWDGNSFCWVCICYLFLLLLWLNIGHGLINDSGIIRIVGLLKSWQKLWLFL